MARAYHNDSLEKRKIRFLDVVARLPEQLQGMATGPGLPWGFQGRGETAIPAPGMQVNGVWDGLESGIICGVGVWQLSKPDFVYGRGGEQEVEEDEVPAC